MLDSVSHVGSLIPINFIDDVFQHLLSSHPRFAQIVDSASSINSNSLFSSTEVLKKALLKSELRSLVDFISSSFPKVKLPKSGNKLSLSTTICDFLTAPPKFFPSSVVLQCCLSTSSISLCPHCAAEMNNNDVVFSFCHFCVPPSFSPSIRIPSIVSINLAYQLSFSISLVFKSLIEKNVWNPSPFFFDRGHKYSTPIPEIGFSRMKDIEKTFESLLWSGRYSSAHAALNKQEIASINEDTFLQLQNLHPDEDFSFNSAKIEVSHNYWLEILSSQRNSAPGLSGLSYDHLKIACEYSITLVEDCCKYFNKLLSGLVSLPEGLVNSKLVALRKPNGSVRPIAISESIMRLLAITVVNRIKSKKIQYLQDYQWGIGVVDGASSAVQAVEPLLYNDPSRAALLLDFSNAFYAVNRPAILSSIDTSPLTPLLPYFNNVYSLKSQLIFHSFSVLSASGVKQGDPLGPLLFCLALHSVLEKFKIAFPQLDIVGYM
ncbi:hypothetical protein RCL1_007561 [Eukaryota sp. TZLM3-RCL]